MEQVNCFFDKDKNPNVKTFMEHSLISGYSETYGSYEENYYNYIYFIHRHMYKSEDLRGLVGKVKYIDETYATFFLYIPYLVSFDHAPSLGINELFIEDKGNLGIMGKDITSKRITYKKNNLTTDKDSQTCSMQTYNVKQIEMLASISKLLTDIGGIYHIDYYNAISNVIGVKMNINEFITIHGGRRNTYLTLNDDDNTRKIFEFLQLLGIEDSFRFKKDDIYVKIKEGELRKSSNYNKMFPEDNMYENKYLKYKLKYLILKNLSNK